jgi:hypothetical protein
VIALSIIKCEEKRVGLDFELSIHLIRFILKLESLQETWGEDHSVEVIRKVVDRSGGFTESQGKRWRDWGYRLAGLAGAGDYFLIFYSSFLSN